MSIGTQSMKFILFVTLIIVSISSSTIFAQEITNKEPIQAPTSTETTIINEKIQDIDTAKKDQLDYSSLASIVDTDFIKEQQNNLECNVNTIEPEITTVYEVEVVTLKPTIVKNDKFYRVVLKDDKKTVVVQDFYLMGEKRTEPFEVASEHKTPSSADLFVYDQLGITGPFTLLFQDGQIEQKGLYEHGVRKGFWVSWYNNGQKERSGRYKEGIREGQWTTWYKNGKRMQKGLYKSGKKEGVWILWYENGKKKEAGRYISDEKVERWSYWDASGKMIKSDSQDDEGDL